MNDWELIFTMIGEKATTDITVDKNSQGLKECKESAKQGGEIGHDTRKSIESKLKRSVISKSNFNQIREPTRVYAA